jgi:hypothetical protein
MAMLHKFMTSAGSEVLPTNGGPYYTEDMSADWMRGQIYIEFFSDAAGTVPAIPTAGEVVASGTPMGNVYMAPGNVGSVQASNVGGDPMYEPPEFLGCVIRGRLTFSGITGAPYARAVFWRS